MKNIETEVGLEDVHKLTLEQLDEVISNLKKLHKQPSSCEEAGYRHILVYNPGWEFMDGTKHLLYKVRYQNNKEEPFTESLRIEEYKHQEVKEL